MCLMRLKNKNILIILVIGIMLIVSMFFTFNNKKEYKELPKVKLKEPLQNKQFALMLEQENGEYKESSDDFPTEGYVFNETKSGCTDLNGKKINDVLEYDYTNYSLTLNTNKTSYCYLYYDIEPNIKFFRSKDKDNHLTKELTGGLYRYQGIYEKDEDGNVTNDVENYLCLGNDCGEFGEDLYRIIGINAKGELKVIKKTTLSKSYSWYNDTITDIKWPDSLIYHGLNDDGDSFYNSLDSKLKEKIVTHKWLYGDNTLSGYDGELCYNIESGNTAASYFKKTETGYETSTYTWDTNKDYINAKIGLQYLHDFLLAYPGGNSETPENASKSWIFFLNNDDSPFSLVERLMTRYGYGGPNGTNSPYLGRDVYGADNIKGQHGGNLASGKYSLRPVFYLTNEIELIGEGTLAEPFEIDYEKTGVDIINSKPANLSIEEVGGMHRYQGTKDIVNNNYICFGTNNREECLNNQDNYLYRILGISSNGEMKLMKQKFLSVKYKWSANYTEDVGWPDSDIFNAINNEGFLDNENYLSKNSSINWSNKIIMKDWYYGNVMELYSLTGEEFYNIEIGKAAASWYERLDGVTSPSENVICEVVRYGLNKDETRCFQKNTNEWTDKVSAKVGIPYMHDVRLSLKNNTVCSSNDNCQNSWFFDFNTNDHQYLIPKYGYLTNWDAYVNYSINNEQIYIRGNSVISDNSFNIRPTFYIDSNTTYQGNGTINYPYLVIK